MKKVANIGFVLFIVVCVLAVYTLIHEWSHAILVFIFGGRITTFDINFLIGRPYVRYIGDLSLWKKGMVSIAGYMVPYFIWLVAIIKIRRDSALINRKIMFIASLNVLGSILPNIFLPILYEYGVDVHGEDVVNFIQFTRMNSYAVSIMMALLFLLGCILLFKNIDIKNTIIHQIEINTKKNRTKVSILGMTILSAVILVIFSLNMSNIMDRSTYFDVPTEYKWHISKALDEKDFQNDIIYEFDVSEPRIYSFYSNANSREVLALTIKGNESFYGTRKNELVLLEGSGKMQSTFTGWYLKEGKYQIKLSTKDNIGSLDIYLHDNDAPEDIEKYANEKIFKGELPVLDDGYKLATHLMLRDTENENIYEFTLEKNQKIELSIFLTTREGKAVVKLSGSELEEILIQEDQVYTDGRGTFLEKGIYKITLTSEGCDGELFIFIKDL